MTQESHTHQHVTTGRVLDLLENTHPSSPVDIGPDQVALRTMFPDNPPPQAQEAGSCHCLAVFRGPYSQGKFYFWA